MEEAFGAPHYQMHRADVLEMLVSHLPAGVLHTGKAVVGLTDRGAGVDVAFADGTGTSADIVVGADGIHSTIREALFGPDQAVFKNCIAFRGLIPRARVADLSIPVEAQIWMGPGRHFVHYYVRRGELFNFVANVDASEWKNESWTEAGDVAEAIHAFEGWHPQIQAILNAVDETFVLALHDRRPLERWTKGHVTLLGDACHPMEPHVAQGAAQAIEDGAALASCLRESDSISAALSRYEDIRRPRTSRVQALADSNRKRFHLPDGDAQEARDAEMAGAETDFSLASVGWLYGHDAFDTRHAGETYFGL
jgi:salicylate hydroxylase